MKLDLFPFQTLAIQELRKKSSSALKNYKETSAPQVISLQAPTGAGKTIIMAAFIEDVFYGTEDFVEQPNAVFVWLSDSPQLNEQSKNKFLKSDKIRLNQCITIKEESFDQATFDDGKIYFLNTQKIGKAGNLSKEGDNRAYTIWQTVENTARQKSDRFYLIIDEAHRGMQGTEAGKATSIMQRFLIGAPNLGLSAPVPLVIGVSATPARFNALFGNTTSTLNFIRISPEQVRESGLLKDRIVITYPEDTTKNNDMAVLDAATDEWMSKALHWKMYYDKQHSKMVNPIFVIQVKAGSNGNISDTNLDNIIQKIEVKINRRFNEGEVVHTFGQVGTIQINGLKVSHIEPNDIVDDKRVRVVLFKENLSTGWDCPRAETMMSFRTANDVTYIAQLLGRMVRTPLQTHIKVDETLNEVRMYLPYFDKSNVKSVIDELLQNECGDIAPFVDTESMETPTTQTLTVHVVQKKNDTKDDSDNYDGSLFDDLFDSGDENKESKELFGRQGLEEKTITKTVDTEITKKTDITYADTSVSQVSTIAETPKDDYGSSLFELAINRPEVTKFINDLGLLTYTVKPVRINSYLKSMTSLAALLTREGIDRNALGTITKDIVEMIHLYVESLKALKEYEKLVKEVLTCKLSIKIFDMFGQDLFNGKSQDFYTTSNSEIEMQMRIADAKLAGFGFPKRYGEQYYDPNNPDDFKIDCILFVLNDDCITKVNKYAENKFHELDDKYRRVLVSKSEKLRKQYDSIIEYGDAVSKHTFSLPEEIQIPEDTNGKEYLNHLFANEKTGKATIHMNTWEEGVIEEESIQPDFVCWLRNQPRASWALCIPYEINNEPKAAYPDYLIVRRDDVTGYVIDILEPHNPAFSDNLPKAQGFAKYAATEPRIGRVQIIRKAKNAAGKDSFLRLDFSKGSIREKVLKMQNNQELDHLFETDGEFLE